MRKISEETGGTNAATASVLDIVLLLRETLPFFFLMTADNGLRQESYSTSTVNKAFVDTVVF